MTDTPAPVAQPLSVDEAWDEFAALYNLPNRVDQEDRDMIREALDAARSVPDNDLEGDAGKCPTCGLRTCIGRLQYEDCVGVPDNAALREAGRTLYHADWQTEDEFIEAFLAAAPASPAGLDVPEWASGLVPDDAVCDIEHVKGMKPHRHLTLPADLTAHACPVCGDVHLPASPADPEEAGR